jgi:hypothetical protein
MLTQQNELVAWERIERRRHALAEIDAHGWWDPESSVIPPAPAGPRRWAGWTLIRAGARLAGLQVEEVLAAPAQPIPSFPS